MLCGQACVSWSRIYLPNSSQVPEVGKHLDSVVQRGKSKCYCVCPKFPWQSGAKTVRKDIACLQYLFESL